jgi:ribosomal protein S18 acetylase RimI-like enzyme
VARPLIVEIERLGWAAAPAAESSTVSGWSVNLGRGEVGRMNSVTTFGHVPDDIFETVETVERRYRSRRRPVAFRLTPLDAELDDLLFARGYDRSEEILVMQAPVNAGDREGIEILAGVTGRWLERYAAFRPSGPARAAEIGESLASLALPHATFLFAEAAVGTAVVDGRWAGLFNVAVDPARRRQGLGRTLSRGMLDWAAWAGAERAYLQVEEGNLEARGLYRSLGFEAAYRYWYRRRE